MGNSIGQYVRAFEEYAAGYAQRVGADRDFVLLKRDHSLRVLANGRAIAASLDLDPVAKRTCALAALLHDTGRFPQYLVHKTFDDARSENHGLLGVKSLKRWGVLEREEEAVRRGVLTAVGLHNRRAVPAMLPPELQCPLRVVRDADKIDILPVIADQLERQPSDSTLAGHDAKDGGHASHRDGVILLHLERDGRKYTPSLLEAVLAGRNGEYSAMRYTTDFALLLCSWAFDFNYPFSRRMVLERGDMERIFALLPDTAQMDEVVDRVRTVLAS